MGDSGRSLSDNLRPVLKNVFLGAIGGGVLGAAIAAVAAGLMMASDRHWDEYAFLGALVVAPLGATHGAIAGGLAARQRPFQIGLICAGLGLAAGFLLFLTLASISPDNVRMGLLTMIVAAVGSFCVGAPIARWRRPKS